MEGTEKNGISFEADMNSSVHIDNKGKDFLILGEGRTQGLKWYNNKQQKQNVQLILHSHEKDLH